MLSLDVRQEAGKREALSSGGPGALCRRKADIDAGERSPGGGVRVQVDIVAAQGRVLGAEAVEILRQVLEVGRRAGRDVGTAEDQELAGDVGLEREIDGGGQAAARDIGAGIGGQREAQMRRIDDLDRTRAVVPRWRRSRYLLYMPASVF